MGKQGYSWMKFYRGRTDTLLTGKTPNTGEYFWVTRCGGEPTKQPLGTTLLDGGRSGDNDRTTVYYFKKGSLEGFKGVQGAVVRFFYG